MDATFPALDRYLLRGPLGGGAMGIVYEAFDKERNAPVAIKVLKSVSANHIYQFKQEFRTLQHITHANLVTLYELVNTGDQWFIVMELIRGQPFHHHVRGEMMQQDSLSHTFISDMSAIDEESISEYPVEMIADLDRLRTALVQLLRGVAALHEHGRVHRDLKPSNVLVDKHGRVVLVDFGLVYETDRALSEQTHADKLQGTAAFLAPETVAGQVPSAASDMYSVGVILYQALLGRLPHLGSMARVLVAKQVEDPPEPRDLVPDVPSDLNRLAMDLLSREPSARPSARAALERLGIDPSLVTMGLTPVLRAGGGRQQQRDILNASWERAKRGRVSVVTLRGASGMGKTTLAREFLKGLRQDDDLIILHGRCYERESVPFKAFDSLMDGLRRRLRRMEDAERKAVIPEDVELLARLFPVLGEFVPKSTLTPAQRADLEASNPADLRGRAFHASIELVDHLASSRPVAVFLDDVQWGDADSARMLGAWMRRLQHRPVLIILAWRAEDQDGSEFLNVLLRDPFLARIDHQEMRLEALDEADAVDIAQRLIAHRHPEPEAAARWIAREAGGSPHLIAELAKEVVTAASNGDPDLAREGMSLEEVYRQRIFRLPKPARRLLTMVALAGRPLPMRVLARAAEIDDNALSAVTLLRAQHFVRTSQNALGELVEAYHDRIGTALREGTLSAEQATAHLKLATAMEAYGWHEPEALMLHYLNGGRIDRAAELALEAARNAADNLAFDKAARLYRTALSLKDWDAATQEHLRVSLSEALVYAGRGAEAAKEYLAAAEGAGRETAIELRRKGTEQLLRSGHLDEAREHLDQVLAEVGLARTPPQWAMWMLLWLRFRLWLRGSKYKKTRQAKVPKDVLQRIDTCWFVAQALSFIHPVQGALFHTRGLLMALDAGEPYRIVRAQATELPYLVLSGADEAAVGRYQTALRDRLAKVKINRYHVQAVVGLGEGMAAYLDGSFKTAYRQLKSAERTLVEQVPSATFELSAARLYALRALTYVGEFKQAGEQWPQLVQEAENRGNLLLTANLRSDIFVLLRLARGDVQGAQSDVHSVVSRWSSAGYHYQHLSAQRALAMIALYTGDTATAWRIAGEAIADQKRSRMNRNRFARVMGAHLRGRCALASAQNDRTQVGAVKDAVKTLRRERYKWGPAMADALQAGLDRLEGRDPAGRLTSALEGFERADLNLHANLTRRILGQIEGGTDGARKVAAANGWLANQEITDPEGLMRVLLPGFEQ